MEGALASLRGLSSMSNVFSEVSAKKNVSVKSCLKHVNFISISSSLVCLSINLLPPPVTLDIPLIK